MSSAAEKMNKLIEEIEYHRKKYYLDHAPVISDSEYDALERDLLALEKAHPELVRADSPSFRVGSGLASEHPERAHARPMLSLGNTYNSDDLQSYIDRSSTDIGALPTYTAELKIDGLSLSVVYEHGIIARAVTRGDGLVGEEVTANAKTIAELPLRVPEWADYPEMEVRGEVYMDHTTFQYLNEQRLEQGKEVFANPRNASAGSLRLLESGEVAKRKLRLFVYQVLGPWVDQFNSHFEGLQAVGKLGFPTNEHTRRLSKPQEIFDLVEEWDVLRRNLNYETDGIVFKVDDPRLYDRIGYTSKFPKWAAAYKFPAEQATTQIQSIEIQVGRTGVLTPVANFDPTPLAGTVVSRATLHNFDEISKKDIRVGDWVFIEKGGEIIPKVIKVILEKRSEETLPFEPPSACPRCGGPTEQEEDQVAIRCANLTCPAQLERRIMHFAARGAMDIQGLGKERVQQMVSAGVLTNLTDIYRLDREKLLGLDRVGEKWISNLLGEIEKSKSRPFAKVLFAVGIPMIGQKVAELVVERFQSIQALQQANEDAIADIHGLGEKVAWSLFSHLRMDAYRETFTAFAEMGLNLKEEPKQDMGEQPLTEKTMVVTGSFDRWSRTELTAILKDLGAKVTGSVTSKTNILVAGEKAGSKLAKAQSLGVEIVNEDWVLQWLNQEA